MQNIGYIYWVKDRRSPRPNLEYWGSIQLTKKDTFYRKRVLKISAPLFKPFIKGFTAKYIFLNISWEGAVFESWMQFLSRLGPGAVLFLKLFDSKELSNFSCQQLAIIRKYLKKGQPDFDHL